MPRPRKERQVLEPPVFHRFKPQGIPAALLREQALTVDEYEAIRLADHLGRDHADAAVEMGISRSTFTRLIETARRKVAAFLVEGRELVIEGGEFNFMRRLYRCGACHEFHRTPPEAAAPGRCPACGEAALEDLNACHGRMGGGRRFGGMGRGGCGRGRLGRFAEADADDGPKPDSGTDKNESN